LLLLLLQLLLLLLLFFALLQLLLQPPVELLLDLIMTDSKLSRPAHTEGRTCGVSGLSTH
jgi:hypothetical protein